MDNKIVLTVLALIMLTSIASAQAEKTANKLTIIDSRLADQIPTKYPEKVIGEKLADTPTCSKSCMSKFQVDTTDGGKLSIEYYHDDLTFEKPSDNIAYAMIEWYNESMNEWQPYTNQEMQMTIRVYAVKKRNEDTAYRPRVDYYVTGTKAMTITGDNLALWMKGPSIAGNGLESGFHYDSNVNDFSGNGNNGAITGSTAYSPAVYTNGLNFSSRYGRMTFTDPLLKSQNLTIVFWIKPDSLKAISYPLEIYANNNAGNTGILTSLATNRVLSIYSINATASGAATVTLSADNWNMITYIHNTTGTVCKEVIYLNKTSLGSNNCGASGITWGTDGVSIGSYFGGGSPANITVDELMFWSGSTNGILTSSQISNLFDATITEMSITSPGNNTNYTSSQAININTTIGVNGNIYNVTVTDPNGSVNLVNRNLNTTNNFLNSINSTHYLLQTSYPSLPPLVPSWYNVTVCNNESTIISCTSSSLIINVYTSDSLYSQNLTTGGSCLSDPAYALNYTVGAGSNYAVFNLSSLSNMVDSQLRNIIVQRQSGVALTGYYTSNPYILVVDTSDPLNKNITIMISGSGRIMNWPLIGGSFTPVNISLSNFTQIGANVYAVTLYDANLGGLYNLTQPTYNNMTVLCVNHAPDSINLRSYNLNQLVVATKEPAKLIDVSYYSNPTTSRRTVYQSALSSETFNMYQNYNTSNVVNLNIELLDNTGGFQNSYLIIQSNVNGTLQKIWQEQFYNLKVSNITVLNNTYIQYMLYTPTDIRIITWDLITSDSTKTLSVNDIGHSEKQIFDNTLQVSPESSYAASSIGMVWNSTESLNALTLNVYKQNTSYQYEPLYTYTTATPTKSGTVDYIVADNNATYLMKLTITKNNVSYPYQTFISPIYYVTGYQPLSYLMSLPVSILNYSVVDELTFGSIFLVSMTAMMFGAVSYTIGLLMVIAVVGAVFILGFHPWITWTVWLFMLAMGLLDTYGGKRK